MRVALAVDAEFRFATRGAPLLKGLDRCQNAALRVELAGNQELCERRIGRFHITDEALRIDAKVDDLGVVDAKACFRCHVLEGLTAEIKPVEPKGRNGIRVAAGNVVWFSPKLRHP